MTRPSSKGWDSIRFSLIESLSFYIVPKQKFFYLKFLDEIGLFFARDLLYLWMDGMGWMVGQLFFLAHILETT